MNIIIGFKLFSVMKNLHLTRVGLSLEEISLHARSSHPESSI